MVRRFKVIGHGKETKRRRVRVYEATSPGDARRRAEYDDTQVDSVEELPPEPATARQIEYAKSLGIPAPKYETKERLSQLISKAWEQLEKEEIRQEREESRRYEREILEDELRWERESIHRAVGGSVRHTNKSAPSAGANPGCLASLMEVVGGVVALIGFLFIAFGLLALFWTTGVAILLISIGVILFFVAGAMLPDS